MPPSAGCLQARRHGWHAPRPAIPPCMLQYPGHAVHNPTGHAAAPCICQHQCCRRPLAAVSPRVCPPLQVTQLLLQALQPSAGHHPGQVQHRRVLAEGCRLRPGVQGCGCDGCQGQRGRQRARQGSSAQALQQRRLLGGGRRQRRRRLAVVRLPARLHRSGAARGECQGRGGGVQAAAAACPR